MKTILICPAIRPAVPQLAEHTPLAATPIFGESLVAIWIEHVAALGARHVTVISADRPALVRDAVGDGRRWGVAVEFVNEHFEPQIAEAASRHRLASDANWLPAPHDIVVMNHLPNAPEWPLFDSYASWFAALQAWIPRAITPTRVRMSELRPGIWVGAGARIAPSARLQAPCWIGDQVTIEADAVIGPNAILEDRVVIGTGARVSHSTVAPDTFVGQFMAVHQSIATGHTLVNWQNDSVLRVPDAFLLSSLVPMPAVPAPQPSGWLARASVKPAKLLSALFSRSNRADAAKLPG